MYPARNCSGFIIRLLIAANGAKRSFANYDVGQIP